MEMGGKRKKCGDRDEPHGDGVGTDSNTVSLFSTCQLTCHWWTWWMMGCVDGRWSWYTVTATADSVTENRLDSGRSNYRTTTTMTTEA